MSLCEHEATIADVVPDAQEVCPECAAKGDPWVHLRVCMVCGQVGCCDESPNRHARRHWHTSGHAVIQSMEPGETWRWCFADDIQLPDGPPLRR